jgi:hypothetical protein
MAMQDRDHDYEPGNEDTAFEAGAEQQEREAADLGPESPDDLLDEQEEEQHIP